MLKHTRGGTAMIESSAPTQRSKQDIARAIKEILVNEARVNIAPEQLADQEPLNSELLRISSLSFLGVIISLEDALDIRLEDELFMKTKFVTVGDLVDFIYRTYYDGSQP